MKHHHFAKSFAVALVLPGIFPMEVGFSVRIGAWLYSCAAEQTPVQAREGMFRKTMWGFYSLSTDLLIRALPVNTDLADCEAVDRLDENVTLMD